MASPSVASISLSNRLFGVSVSTRPIFPPIFPSATKQVGMPPVNPKKPWRGIILYVLFGALKTAVSLRTISMLRTVNNLPVVLSTFLEYLTA